MMTTMCALLAGLPLMLGHGPGSELRRPLGYAMVGGLLLSQALTLFTTPVVYHLSRPHPLLVRTPAQGSRGPPARRGRLCRRQGRCTLTHRTRDRHASTAWSSHVISSAVTASRLVSFRSSWRASSYSFVLTRVTPGWLVGREQAPHAAAVCAHRIARARDQKNRAARAGCAAGVQECRARLAVEKVEHDCADSGVPHNTSATKRSTSAASRESQSAVVRVGANCRL